MQTNKTGQDPPLDVAQVTLGQGRGEARTTKRSHPGPAGRRRQPFFSSWRVTAAFVLTVVALIGSVLLAIPIADPMGPFGSWSPLAWVHDARADHFLSKENPSLGDLSQAESESWVALSQAPVDDVAWTNLAYIDRLRNGKLTSRGLKWLQRSYDVAPFGPTVSPWRIRFALENWEALTPELRGEVIDESRAYGGRNPQRLEQIAHQIRDPAGRLAGTLLMSQLTLEKAKTP